MSDIIKVCDMISTYDITVINVYIVILFIVYYDML